VNVEYRTVTLRARSRIPGSDLDAAVLDNELRRAGADGWQLVTAVSSRMGEVTPSRYFVLVMCRHRR
jgi:hypothetical protein